MIRFRFLKLALAAQQRKNGYNGQECTHLGAIALVPERRNYGLDEDGQRGAK